MRNKEIILTKIRLTINCLCSIVSTVVNDKGEALAKNLIAKMQKQEEAWIAAGGGVK